MYQLSTMSLTDFYKTYIQTFANNKRTFHVFLQGKQQNAKNNTRKVSQLSSQC